ncbi:MAG: hypothetical protein IT539_04735 [Bradyrhizobiaceae bacterium]|nr:hypothetical protein [Bradyrhizobiaceae bacterium]
MALAHQQTVGLGMMRGRRIDAADVIALLQEVYADGVLTRAEAEELIAFDLSLTQSTRDWQEFFASAIGEHITRNERASGSAGESAVACLIEKLSRGSRPATAAGFAAIRRVIEHSKDPAPQLAAFAVEQVRAAVVTGDGAASGWRTHLGRTIDATDTALLHSLLVAAGGKASRPVTRVEAEAMFNLHDAVAAANNHPSFDDLFFKAIAHHLLAAAGCAVLSRRDMLAPDPQLVERASMFGRNPARLSEQATFTLPAECVQSAKLPSDDLAWLAGQIMRDGRATLAEYALLRLFTGAADGADPSFRGILEHAA